MKRGHAAFVAALTLVACGGAPAAPGVPESQGSVSATPRHEGPTVESEVGALSEEKVKETFERASNGLMRCYRAGADKIAYLAGDVRLAVRVKADGTARTAFVKDSTLGDRATEQCMVDVLRKASWPKPVGGAEGIAESSFTFTPDGEERPPVAWSPDQLGAPFKKAQAALKKCKQGAGNATLKATLYVETDGKPKAIGVSSSDERGEAAIACVIDTLSSLTFPSPGSWASKVTVEID